MGAHHARLATWGHIHMSHCCSLPWRKGCGTLGNQSRTHSILMYISGFALQTLNATTLCLVLREQCSYEQFHVWLPWVPHCVSLSSSAVHVDYRGAASTGHVALQGTTNFMLLGVLGVLGIQYKATGIRILQSSNQDRTNHKAIQPGGQIARRGQG